MGAPVELPLVLELVALLCSGLVQAVARLPLEGPVPVAVLALLLGVRLIPGAQEQVDQPHDDDRRHNDDQQARGGREVRIPVRDALEGTFQNAQFFPLILRVRARRE